MTNFNQSDEQFMRRALELARTGIGVSSPNPCVGAVVVDKTGAVAGSGTHTYEGRKHAEVLALEQAGPKAAGAALYVNLEPCSHQGRSGPCADAVVAAGIRRVVASMEDPNPLVQGQGFARLNAAGIEVVSGVLENEAKALNESFAKFIRHRTPLITLKSAMTLDGKIAPPGAPASIDREWITSEAARAHVQELRHQHDAILVGVGTVIADDPMLTDRSGLGRRRPLLRVILDSQLRLPLESRVIQTAAKDVLILCSNIEKSGEKKIQELERRGVRVQQVEPTPDGRPDMKAVARTLGELQIASLLIEGGATVNWAALSGGVVDKVFLYYAPMILAGSNAMPFAAGAGFARLSDAPHVRSIKVHRFGQDFAVEGYLRDPYGE